MQLNSKAKRRRRSLFMALAVGLASLVPSSSQSASTLEGSSPMAAMRGLVEILSGFQQTWAAARLAKQKGEIPDALSIPFNLPIDYADSAGCELNAPAVEMLSGLSTVAAELLGLTEGETRADVLTGDAAVDMAVIMRQQMPDICDAGYGAQYTHTAAPDAFVYSGNRMRPLMYPPRFLQADYRGRAFTPVIAGDVVYDARLHAAGADYLTMANFQRHRGGAFSVDVAYIIDPARVGYTNDFCLSLQSQQDMADQSCTTLPTSRVNVTYTPPGYGQSDWDAYFNLQPARLTVVRQAQAIKPEQLVIDN